MAALPPYTAAELTQMAAHVVLSPENRRVSAVISAGPCRQTWTSSSHTYKGTIAAENDSAAAILGQTRRGRRGKRVLIPRQKGANSAAEARQKHARNGSGPARTRRCSRGPRCSIRAVSTGQRVARA
eukprot:3530175-Rhodomonas_salina.3